MWRLVTFAGVAVLLAEVAGAQGKVWVIGGAGADFSQVQAGVDAAAEGDVLLIREHSGSGYGTVVISGKSLSLIADTGEDVVVQSSDWQVPALRLEGLGPSQSFFARGITFLGGPALELDSNEGDIMFEECTCRGSFVTSQTPAGRGAVLVDCTSVAFVRCQILGGAGALPFQVFLLANGGDAFAVATSTAHLYESTIIGGPGSSAHITSGVPPGGDGGDGATLQDSLLFAAASEIEGGTGGFAFFFCNWAGDGGDGLVVSETSQAFELQSTFDAGATGYCASLNGDPVVGSVTSLPGRYRSMSAPSPVREEEVSTSTYTGQEGDLVFGMWGFQQDHAFYEVFGGTVLPAVLAANVLGVVPAGGTLSIDVPLGQLPPGWDSLSLFSQAVVLPADAPLILTNATGVVILDDLF